MRTVVRAIVALCAAVIVIKDARHWRTGDRRHASFRTVVVSVLILLGLSVAAVARPAHGVIGGRPAGCPHAYCGCGASLHLFGRIIPKLNLAVNWLRFPRTSPAPNMVAARRGHVFVLKQHIAGNTWLVHDSNSGHGRTRIHPRSISGYVVVNPHGALGFRANHATKRRDAGVLPALVAPLTT